MEFIRTVFFALDTIIYQFIPKVYSFVRDLINMTGSFFSDDAIRNTADKIYSIIAIVMIIRISFIILGYIVNPDEFYDGKKGPGNIIKRVVIVLILVVGVRFIFNIALDLQKQIVNNRIIEKLIIGNTTDNSGDNIAVTTLNAFLSCPSHCTDSNTVTIDNLSNIKINTKVSSQYMYNYVPVMSTAAGLFVLYMLIVFAYDIALRIVKFGFLQIIAPIPVMAYLDPKSDFKSGITGKWVEITMSTYLLLFIRLLSLAFMIYVINLIPDVFKTVNVGSEATPFIKVFLVIGTLMFVKEAPKLLGDIFGFKGDLGMGELKALNPLGKMAGGALIGGALGLGTGLAMKGVGGAGGFLRGGFNSAIRGESFKGGALKGAIAGAKDIPLKGGLGKQAGALLKGGRAAANAGASYATGQETKTGIRAAIGRVLADEGTRDKAARTLGAGQRFRTAIDSNGEYGKVARDAIKNSNMTQLQKDKETARLNVKGKASVISNTDFRTQYENYELAKSFEKAEKGELNRLEIDLDNKRAGFQRGEVTFDQLNSAQDAVKTQRIEVAKAESAKTTLEAVYNEAAKLATNAEDVKSIAQLKAYDDQKSAIDNISKVSTSVVQQGGTNSSATTTTTSTTSVPKQTTTTSTTSTIQNQIDDIVGVNNHSSVTGEDLEAAFGGPIETEMQSEINDRLGINRESKNAYESAKAFGEPTVEDRQVTMDDLLKNNQNNNGNSSTGNK